MSCLAEQAKILCAEAEENNLELKARKAWERWHTCSLCEQKHHGVVRCALGWACWKTYVGRPERDSFRRDAMTLLGNGLNAADEHEAALSVRETELSTLQRRDAPEKSLLGVKNNLSNTYAALGRHEQSLCLQQDVYSGCIMFFGEEYRDTLVAALNYASSLLDLQRSEEARALMRKTIPVAQRVLGESHELTLQMRRTYACALIKDPGATLGDFRKAVTTLEETTRTARRVLGNSHPIVAETERTLQNARAALGAHGLTSG